MKPLSIDLTRTTRTIRRPRPLPLKLYRRKVHDASSSIPYLLLLVLTLFLLFPLLFLLGLTTLRDRGVSDDVVEVSSQDVLTRSFRSSSSIPPVTSATTIVRCETTVRVPDREGEQAIEMRIRPEWAPLGAARFLNLVKDGYYDNTPLFRAVDGFLIQFGISLDVAKRTRWETERLRDDPKQPSNPELATDEGLISFAGYAANSRATQVFVTLDGGSRKSSLGTMPWEVPIGRITAETMDVIRHVYTGYGDTVEQSKIKDEDPGRSEEYLAQFPRLDWILRCYVKEASQT